MDEKTNLMMRIMAKGDMNFLVYERDLKHTLSMIQRFRAASQAEKPELGYCIDKTRFSSAGLEPNDYYKRCQQLADKWGL